MGTATGPEVRLTSPEDVINNRHKGRCRWRPRPYADLPMILLGCELPPSTRRIRLVPLLQMPRAGAEASPLCWQRGIVTVFPLRVSVPVKARYLAMAAVSGPYAVYYTITDNSDRLYL